MNLLPDEIKLKYMLASISEGVTNTLITNQLCICKLPSLLPEGLEHLEIRNMTLDRLPSKLPSTLKTLDIYGSNIYYIHDRLPDGLESFTAGINLRAFPSLPSGLKKLMIPELLYIHSLPELPEGLEELIIKKSSLFFSLPSLPSSLKVLSVG